MLRVYNCLLIIFGCTNMRVAAQSVYERHTAELNQYLVRMAQKGQIVWEDNTQLLWMDLITGWAQVNGTCGEV